jgi:hypothetical protein
VTEEYYRGTLREAGFPESVENLAAMVRMTGEMFLIKAQGFIATQDKRAAEAFVDTHAVPSPQNYSAWPQDILNDLVSWNPEVSPHIQDLPARVRAILLQTRGSEGGFFGRPSNQSLRTFWSD